eukprot:gene18171-biopygen21928
MSGFSRAPPQRPVLLVLAARFASATAVQAPRPPPGPPRDQQGTGARGNRRARCSRAPSRHLGSPLALGYHARFKAPGSRGCESSSEHKQNRPLWGSFREGHPPRSVSDWSTGLDLPRLNPDMACSRRTTCVRSVGRQVST